ncbi:MAG: hypothetical protein GY827_05370 [Cytophagales bacterium]|nr:hypothetical protein [Cytophagales bacterium]
MIPKIIIATFLGFMCFIGQFIYRSMQHDIGLVSEDYYKQEIEFQNKIDLRKKSLAFNKEIEVVQLADVLQVNFSSLNPSSYEAHLLNLKENKADKIWNITSPNKKELIDISGLDKSNWRLSIHYYINAEEYLYEQNLSLQ